MWRSYWRGSLEKSEKLLSAQEAADRLGISVDSVYRFAAKGAPSPFSPLVPVRLKGIRIGRRWRFVRGDVEDFLRKLNPEDDRYRLTPERAAEAREATKRLRKKLGLD